MAATARGSVLGPLTVAQLRAARMASLLLDAPAARTPLAVAQWFGALQAQDVASGHWSLGVRCAGSTEMAVVDAFQRGELVRTWPMRGTIHIVPAQDVRWMLALTGERMLATSERRRENLGLTLRDTELACDALAGALAGQRVLTRAQAVQAMVDAGVDVGGQRGYHLLWFAAQTGLTCIGPQRGADQTFVLLADWAPTQVQFTREEALTELLFRFVRSHGPVPLKDFAGWTGLTLGDARAAARANDGRLVPLVSAVGEVWASVELAQRLAAGEQLGHPVVALPGFDEFMLGYKDRSLQVPAGAMERIVPGGNGVFRATVVHEGLVIGTWTRTMRKDAVDVALEPLVRYSRQLRSEVDAAFERYGTFLQRRVRLHVDAQA